MRILHMVLAGTSLGLASVCGSAYAADTTLRYAVPDDPSDTFVIEAAADGRMRIEDGRGQMVILRDGETYVVGRLPDGGRVTSRLEDFLAVGAEVRAQLVESGAMTDEVDEARYEVREEGSRTVGPWQGIVYSISPIEPPGMSREVVISTDPALADAQPIAAAALEAFDGPGRAVFAPPEAALRLSRETLARGTLISLDGLDLQSISRDPIAAERFELPEPLLSRDQLRELTAP